MKGVTVILAILLLTLGVQSGRKQRKKIIRRRIRDLETDVESAKCRFNIAEETFSMMEQQLDAAKYKLDDYKTLLGNLVVHVDENSACCEEMKCKRVCDSKPCFNGGSCVISKESDSGFVCDCAPGYIGELCTTAVDCGMPLQRGYEFGEPIPNTNYPSTVKAESCATGYGEKPTNKTLKCRADKTWEPASGCFRVDCDQPMQPGYIFEEPKPDTQYLSTVKAESCATGYGENPTNKTLKCQADKTWEPASGCSRVDCDQPMQPGYIFEEPKPDTQYLSTVKAESCATGYGENPTNKTLKCQADKTWEPASGCSRVDCDQPMQPGYIFEEPKPDTQYLSTVKAESCATGYGENPTNKTLKCQADKTWEPASGCSRVDCDQPMQPGYIFEEPKPDTQYLSTVKAESCATGYGENPTNKTLKCQADKTWERASGCSRVDCDQPMQPGYIFEEPKPDTQYLSTVKAESCATGYGENPTNKTLKCQADKTWEPASGCSRVDCDQPMQPGYIFEEPKPDTQYLSTVKAESCATGYGENPTNKTLKCQADKTWEPASGCSRVDCDQPMQPGYIFEEPKPDTQYLSTVKAESCATGYGENPTNKTLKCQADKTWEPASGCSRVDCGTPDQDGYTFDTPKPDSKYQGTVKARSCAIGYLDQPTDTTLNCNADGNWDPASGCSAADCGQWRLVYQHNNIGQRVSGNLTELITQMKKGANIRVATAETNMYITSVQNAMEIGNNLCAQALIHISKHGYDKFQTKAYWWFSNICTSGHYHRARYYVGEYNHKGSDRKRLALKWFVRDRSRHILSVNTNGDEVSGSVTNLVDAIKHGNDVRLTTFNDVYSSTLDSLQFNPSEDLATATAVWAVSQKNIRRDGVWVKEFMGGSDYWWFALYDTLPNLKASRWKIGEHSRAVFAIDTTHKTSNKWFTDPCWWKAFESYDNGTAISGSASELVVAAEAGHRIRMLSGGILLEADVVYINGGTLCASFINDLSKSNINTFEPNLNRIMKLACTTGKLKTVKYEVGGNITDSVVESAAMSWFVDSPWKHVLSVEAGGEVSNGSKQALKNAIRTGFEVRFKIRYEGFSVLREADNLKISESEVGAMHVRSIVEDAPDPTLTDSRFWLFNLLSTTGKLERSRWDLAIHYRMGSDYMYVDADWFTK